MVDKRHGGPYDRGSADSYYQRGEDPHYYVGANYNSENKVDITDRTSVEYKEYMLGYEDNERIGSHKKWD